MADLTTLGYRLLARFAEVLPARAINPLSRTAAKLAIKLVPKRVDEVRSNLLQVTGQAPTDALIQKAFASYIRFWLDSLRLPVLTTEQLDKAFVLDGQENLRAAFEKGNGVILALPHIGNWDIAGAWLVTHEIPLTVVVERLKPESLFIWFRDFRQTLGLNVVVNDSAVGTHLLRALKDNTTVALLSDRDVDGTGKPTEFFGKSASIPRGAATLAFRSGAALCPVAVYETETGYTARIQPPLDTTRSGTLREDVERVTLELVSNFEEQISRAPEQWHAIFLPIWKS